MKARLILAGSLGLILSAAGWLMHNWTSDTGEALLLEPANLPVANSPAFSDWKRIWAANNPEPNLLAQAPADQLVRAELMSSPPSPPPAPVATAVAGPSTPEGVEAKLEQILAKLEQVEKRLEVIDKRRQGDTLEKLERLLERVNQLESRLQEAEQGDKTEAATNPFGRLLDWFFMSSSPPDPNQRLRELLNNSEDLRTLQEEWERLWQLNHPSPLPPNRVEGAIQ